MQTLFSCKFYCTLVHLPWWILGLSNHANSLTLQINIVSVVCMFSLSIPPDIFLPCPDNLLVNLSESKDLVIDLLNQLPTLFQDNRETGSALGAALQASFKLAVSPAIIFYLGTDTEILYGRNKKSFKLADSPVIIYMNGPYNIPFEDFLQTRGQLVYAFILKKKVNNIQTIIRNMFMRK